MRSSLGVLLVVTSLSVASGCKKSDAATADGAPATTTAPTSTAGSPAAGTTTTDSKPAKPPPVDDATKKKLVEVFEKNKATMKKCDPLKADLHKSLAAKDFSAVPAKTVAFNACRRGWVTSLMPQISKLGVTEDQAVDEMMSWDLTRK